MTFAFVDLFAGCGGFTVGFRAVGAGRHHVAIESNADCVETLRLNFPEATVISTDARNLDYAELSADVLVAGPPCQGFSALNRNGTGDARNSLSWEVVRFVEDVRPRIVVIENVPRYLTALEGKAVVAALREAGYVVRAETVSLADFGVPQRRVRALVVGCLPGVPHPWPEATHGPRSSSGRPYRTVADAFALLPETPDGVNWHVAPSERPEYSRRYAAIPEGGGRRHLPADLRLPCWRSPTGFSDVMGRLHWHKPAATIRTEFFRPEKGRYLHPVANRPITIREAARLQSFPDGFLFPEHQLKTSIGRQIGNAVPPRAAEAIGRAIRRALGEDPSPVIEAA
jgi:DNA (cytosine-5)-methyltransferase 1